ncbi:MAG: aminotransferase class I/II-fold pyridoxal phosphate-dependent enzyme [Cellulophaga sp.]
MAEFPKKLQNKLGYRVMNNALREMPISDFSLKSSLIDFSSNDYLGFASSEEIFKEVSQVLNDENLFQNGATGARLLSGNTCLHIEVETMLSEFYKMESALIFNSGYDANIGFFSSVPQRGDIVFYDGYIHASIRDGIRLGKAKNYKFDHNSLEDLDKVIARSRKGMSKDCEIYVVTESVFSMDGDSPDLVAIAAYCNENSYHLVVDEAHAVGVFGSNGEGLVQELGIQNQVFAQIVTFGKAMGCHGAAILGSVSLKSFLVNFARSFIYTTALPPHSLATIKVAYTCLSSNSDGEQKRRKLHENITYFKEQLKELNLNSYFIESNSSIHCCIVSGNEKVKNIAKELEKKGFVIMPILSPTVAEGEERLRFCIHTYNTKDEIRLLLNFLTELI